MAPAACSTISHHGAEPTGISNFCSLFTPVPAIMCLLAGCGSRTTTSSEVGRLHRSQHGQAGQRLSRASGGFFIATYKQFKSSGADKADLYSRHRQKWPLPLPLPENLAITNTCHYHYPLADFWPLPLPPLPLPLPRALNGSLKKEKI